MTVSIYTKKIKETARAVSKSAESTLTDIDGNLITNLENKFEIWQRYLEKELFHDIRPEEHEITFDGSWTTDYGNRSAGCHK